MNREWTRTLSYKEKQVLAFLSSLPVPGEPEETETTDSHPKDGDCVLRKQTRKPRSSNDLKEHSLVFPDSLKHYAKNR